MSLTKRRSSRGGFRLEILESRTMLSVDLPGLAAIGSARTEPEGYAFDRILVRYRSDASEWVSAEGPAPDLLPGLRILPVPAGVSVGHAVEFTRSDPRVLHAQPDYRVSVASLPDDPGFGFLWGLRNTGQEGGRTGADIGAVEAWSVTTGNPSVVVAVVDTGIDVNHPDLAGNLWVNPDGEGGPSGGLHGWNFVSNSPNVHDDHGHGTHVAGTIGAVGNNGVGVVGVNWDVRLMALKTLDSSGRGYTSNSIRALNYAVAMGAHVSNHSYGSRFFDQSFADAIAAARDAGHVVVAAAGNAGANNDSIATFPANYSPDNVISVAASDRHDNLAGFSNYGSDTVHLAAPGVGILSTFPNERYAEGSGTSMAAPHVAGAVAMIRGLRPDWSYRQVIDAILENVEPLPALAGKVSTGGRLNLGRAVTSAAVVRLGGGGFEAPDAGPAGSYGSFRYAPAGTAWSYAGGAGVAADGSGFTAGNPPAPEGRQVAFIQGDGRIGQDVQVAPGAAGTYRLSLRAAQRDNHQTGGYHDFAVELDGVEAARLRPAGAAYEALEVTLRLDAGARAITLVGVNTAGGDNTSLIDDLRLDRVASMQAPLGDGGFERPDAGPPGQFGSFRYGPAGTAWSYAGGAGVAADGSGFTAGNPPAPEGRQVAFLQQDGAISQAVAVPAAGAYRLSLRAAQRGNHQPGGYHDFAVTVDGVEAARLRPAGTSYGPLEATLTLAAGVRTIALRGVNTAGGDNTSLIDDLRLEIATS